MFFGFWPLVFGLGLRHLDSLELWDRVFFNKDQRPKTVKSTTNNGQRTTVYGQTDTVLNRNHFYFRINFLFQHAFDGH
jgi:hypothetical protein